MLCARRCCIKRLSPLLNRPVPPMPPLPLHALRLLEQQLRQQWPFPTIADIAAVAAPLTASG